MYEFPSGSALSEKESIYDSAKRELIEETGIRYEKKIK
jgi:8-oxo-dGTP pyrophosphatase MutT (NUDIX family)